MRRHIFYLFSGTLFILSCVSMSCSCQGNSEILQKTGSWQIEAPPNAVIEFYYLKENLPEDSLKNMATQIARNLLKNYSNAEIYIFYDRKFAKKIASKKVKEHVLKGAMGLDESVFWDTELKVMGGALMRMSKEKPEGEWHFLERMQLE